MGEEGKIKKPDKGPGSEMQSINLKDYLDQKQKEESKKPFKLPAPAKIFLLVPFVIIGLFGLLFIPYVIYQISTGKEVKKDKAADITYSDIMKKRNKDRK